MITYFTDARDFKSYSTMDKNGFSETLFKSEKSKSIDHCQSQIRKSLIDSITNLCENKNEIDFAFKHSKPIWYCGDWHFVRITYENGKSILFKYPYADEENKQFFLFETLSNQILKDSLSAKLENSKTVNLRRKQKHLSDIAFKRDSVMLAILPKHNLK